LRERAEGSEDNFMKQEDAAKLVAKVNRLDALVNYQEGSIVSRTIIDKKTGTLTLFAFWKGQALSEHTAPFDALVYIVDGEADVIISGVKHGIKQGEMIIMPANEPHALNAVNNFKMLLVMIRA
jgi:quercetin dioxygenase-like cupin family protein